MQTPQYEPSQVVQKWNDIEVYKIDGKYGHYHPEKDILVPPIYDSIERDKDFDFIVVEYKGCTGFLSADDGHFITFGEETHDPYMLAIPLEEYLNKDLPDWWLELAEIELP